MASNTSSNWRSHILPFVERHVGSVIALAAILTMAVVSNFSKNREIDGYWGRTPGTFVSIKTSGKGGPWARFEYTVNGKRFEVDDRPGSSANTCFPLRSCLGKKFMIDYSTQNPDVSRVNWAQPID
jgi:hypothetical protein